MDIDDANSRFLAAAQLYTTAKMIEERSEPAVAIGLILGTITKELAKLSLETVGPATLLAWAVEYPLAASVALAKLYPESGRRTAAATEWSNQFRLAEKLVSENELWAREELRKHGQHD